MTRIQIHLQVKNSGGVVSQGAAGAGAGADAGPGDHVAAAPLPH